ncbi:MAG: ferritin, partial [Clostridia bacterium]|nr:ferritin [Clostridia bacterium]
MLNAKVHELLNQQINKEFYSAYLYLDFSNYFKAQGLDGFANWYMVQAQEERDHAILFYTYLQNENMPVTLEAIAKPDKEITCHMDVLKAGLEHEHYVTSLINEIYGAAYDVRDFRTMQFLDW